MGQVNFEQQAKEKFAHRDIQPSIEAWNRLDALLSAQEKPKKKFPIWWVAASIISAVLLLNFLLSPQNAIEKTPSKIVTKESHNDNMPAKTILQPNFSKPILQKQPIVAIKPSTVHKVLPTSKVSNLESVSLKEPIGSVQNENKKAVDFQEIKSIDTPIVVADAKVKVDPEALLSQVDGELELSFREKVISKINKNYQTVKVALANRNNQE